MNEKWQRMQALASQSVRSIPGAIDLIQMLFKAGYTLAVASAANHSYVNTVLHTLKVIQYFTAIVSTDHVIKGKPDPECFLLAAEKMNISRQTLGRILESAHKKIADALVNGKALLIEGGPIELISPAAGPQEGPPYRFRRGHGGPGHCRRGRR